MTAMTDGDDDDVDDGDGDDVDDGDDDKGDGDVAVILGT